MQQESSKTSTSTNNENIATLPQTAPSSPQSADPFKHSARPGLNGSVKTSPSEGSTETPEKSDGVWSRTYKRGEEMAKELFRATRDFGYAFRTAPRELLSVDKRKVAFSVGLSVFAGALFTGLNIATSCFNAELAGTNKWAGAAYVVGVSFFASMAVEVFSSFLQQTAKRTVSNGMVKAATVEVGRRRSSELGTEETTDKVIKATNKAPISGELVGALSGVMASSASLAIYGGVALYLGLSFKAGLLVAGMLVPTTAIILYSISINRNYEEKFAKDMYRLDIINKDLIDLNKSRTLQMTGGAKLLRQEQQQLTEKITKTTSENNNKFAGQAVVNAAIIGVCLTSVMINIQTSDNPNKMILSGIISSFIYQIYPLLRSAGTLSNYAVFLKSLKTLKDEKLESTISTGRDLKSSSVGLVARNTSFSYDKKDTTNRRMILDSSSLTVEPSRFMVLYAGEGVGKSTVMDILAGIKNTESGTLIILDGDQTVPLGEVNQKKWLEEYLGYIPQKAELNDGFTLGQNLLAKCDDEKCDRELLNRLLDAVNRPQWRELMEQKVGEQSMSRAMSGGESQIALLIRTLMARPKILLLDEPFSKLHQPTVVNLIDMLKGLKDSGLFDYQPTILMITHDSRQAELAEEIAYIPRDSSTIFQGTHEQLKATQPEYEASVTAYSKKRNKATSVRGVPDATTVLTPTRTANDDNFDPSDVGGG